MPCMLCYMSFGVPFPECFFIDCPNFIIETGSSPAVQLESYEQHHFYPVNIRLTSYTSQAYVVKCGAERSNLSTKTTYARASLSRLLLPPPEAQLYMDGREPIFEAIVSISHFSSRKGQRSRQRNRTILGVSST